jgi:hypothetical protein
VSTSEVEAVISNLVDYRDATVYGVEASLIRFYSFSMIPFTAYSSLYSSKFKPPLPDYHLMQQIVIIGRELSTEVQQHSCSYGKLKVKRQKYFRRIMSSGMGQCVVQQTLSDTAEQCAASNIRAKWHRGIPLKSWYTYISVHDFTPQKTVFIIVPFMRMSNTTKNICIVFFTTTSTARNV